MAFIEIGNRKINLDQILWADKGDNHVAIAFEKGSIRFDGEDATKLWKALRGEGMNPHKEA